MAAENRKYEVSDPAYYDPLIAGQKKRVRQNSHDAQFRYPSFYSYIFPVSFFRGCPFNLLYHSQSLFNSSSPFAGYCYRVDRHDRFDNFMSIALGCEISSLGKQIFQESDCR